MAKLIKALGLPPIAGSGRVKEAGSVGFLCEIDFPGFPIFADSDEYGGGVINLSPHEFLDRLAALVPPSRKYRHRYHGVSEAPDTGMLCGRA